MQRFSWVFNTGWEIGFLGGEFVKFRRGNNNFSIGIYRNFSGRRRGIALARRGISPPEASVGKSLCTSEATASGATPQRPASDTTA